MHDDFLDVDDAVDADRQQVGVGLNDDSQARASIGPGLEHAAHGAVEPDKWNSAALENQRLAACQCN